MAVSGLEKILQPEKTRTFRLRTYTQRNPERCGVAAIRSVLDSQFGVAVGEQNLVDSANAYYRCQDAGKVVDGNGTSPQAMTYCFHQKAPEPVKVFCSKHGTVDKLEILLSEQKLLPIIHQVIFYDKENKLDGHYLLYCGITSKSSGYVRIFDPSRKEGYKHYCIDDFHRRWKNKDERWYLVAMPEEIILPQRKFKGRYL